jgi:hypothetical protein
VSFLIASPDIVQGAAPEFGGYSFVAGPGRDLDDLRRQLS